MPSATALPEPGSVFQAYEPEQSELRQHYLFVASDSDATRTSSEGVASVVRKSASLLELLAIAVSVGEALDELGVPTLEKAGRSQDYFRSRIRSSCGLDPSRILADAEREFGPFPVVATGPTQVPPLEAMVRATQSFVEACPIDVLEKLASANAIEEWGHRCRIAYDCLRAFVIRHSKDYQERIRVIGRAYSEGNLTIHDTALLLGMNVPETILVLEKGGFQRPIDALILSQEDRRSRIAKMRIDRLKRKGLPEPSLSAIIRDVLSSERIEGVDARAWMPREQN